MCFEACNTLGISYKLTKRTTRSGKPFYTVWIGGRDNLKRLHRCVTLGSADKQAALDEVEDSYVHPRTPTKAQLKDMLRRGLTHREMSAELGYSGHASVYYHLKKCGLI